MLIFVFKAERNEFAQKRNKLADEHSLISRNLSEDKLILKINKNIFSDKINKNLDSYVNLTWVY